MAVIERELRPVPGAHDRSLLQRSFRQRAAKMCARVREGADASALSHEEKVEIAAAYVLHRAICEVG
jgi:hypothetical protein